MNQGIALFPGQGSQYVGMGKELVQNFPIARELFEEASEAIKFDLKKLCFDGPESDLTKTENTQPALVVTSVAAFKVAEKEAGFKPILVAGHSLGEYSALVAAQAIEFSTAVKWVRSRGQAMQSAVPLGEGSMAAIMGGDDQLVTKLCDAATQKARALNPAATVEPANFNAPGQVVIAGTTAAIQAAVELAKAGGDFAGLKAIPLQVSAPFHCSLMKPAREHMSQVFIKSNTKPTRLSCPYIPNRTGRITAEPTVILDFLVEQIDHPVLWRQSIEAIVVHMNAHHPEFEKIKALECGPGKVLAGLVKRITKGGSKEFLVHNVESAESIAKCEEFFKS